MRGIQCNTHYMVGIYSTNLLLHQVLCVKHSLEVKRTCPNVLCFLTLYATSTKYIFCSFAISLLSSHEYIPCCICNFSLIASLVFDELKQRKYHTRDVHFHSKSLRTRNYIFLQIIRQSLIIH